jgi:hypothetical protein
MKISKYSKNHIMRGAADWEVPKDHFDPIYNYMIHGLEPGSFFSAVLANDFFKAMQHSHPVNSIAGLKNLAGWIRSTMSYGIFWGSESVVKQWLKLTEVERREQLEALNLIFPEKEEIVMILKDQRTVEPYFHT